MTEFSFFLLFLNEFIPINLIKNCFHFLSPRQPLITQELAFIKLICKEFWIQLFGKQIDRLQTNNAGMYVLKDEYFKPVSRIFYDDSKSQGSPEDAQAALAQFDQHARIFVSYTMGMLRGAIQSFGLDLSLAFRFETPTTSSKPSARQRIPVAVFTFCLQTEKDST